MSMMNMMLAGGGVALLDTFSCTFLLIAGGGDAPTNDPCGGGGAGGVISAASGSLQPGNFTSISPPTLAGAVNFAVTIGSNGSNSVFSGTDSSSSSFTYTAIAGGAGGGGGGGNGGSGGGGDYPDGNGGQVNVIDPSTGNTVNPLQGNAGYNGSAQNPAYCNKPWALSLPQCLPTARHGGGGGGAGGSPSFKNGGIGIESSITGTAIFYAGGGAGRDDDGTFGTGGSGYLNYGGGGHGGSGQSGVLILRYTSDATISNPGGGLTMSTASVGSDFVTTITAGTGNIQFN